MKKESVRAIQLHSFQSEALLAPERFVGLVSGIQSGKTLAGTLWTREQYDAYPTNDGLICAPTYKILMQSTLPKFFEINSDLKRYWKRSDQIIEIPNRGKIYIRSTENPNILEGMTLRWIWADEAGQMSYDAWVAMQGRVSILKGRIFLTTTPYRMNWLYSDFYKKTQQQLPDYKLVQFRSIDNPYFPKEEFERVKRELDKRVFQRRYCGLFTKMEGLVYEQFEQGRHVITKEQLPKTFDFVLAGIDWGYTAPTAIVVWAQGGPNYYLVDEFKRSHMTNAEIVEKAKAMQMQWHINRFYADSAEPDRIEEFKRAGLTVYEGSKDILTGINKFRQLIIDNRAFVTDYCVKFLEEIEEYHYPEIKPEKPEDEKPEKINDHLLDATRYIFGTHIPIIGSRVHNERSNFRRFMARKRSLERKMNQSDRPFRMV